MSVDRAGLQKSWESSSDEEILKALYVCPDEYNAEVIEILEAMARRRGLEQPGPDVIESLRREHFGALAAAEGQAHSVGNREMRCQFCGHGRFRVRSVPAGAAISNLLGIEGPAGMECVICAECGFIHWFA